mgnify:CR=1 FL=1
MQAGVSISWRACFRFWISSPAGQPFDLTVLVFEDLNGSRHHLALATYLSRDLTSRKHFENFWFWGKTMRTKSGLT